MSSTRPVAIEIDCVSKSWDGGNTFAVEDLSLHVDSGEVIALLGGSGSGKSTTVKMINRLVEPTRGTIRIDGEDIRQQDPVRLRRHIGYVFQAIGLFPHMTVAQNVALVPRLSGRRVEETTERVEQLLDLVHLPPAEYGARYPAELSGGQRQRVGFARALAADAHLMLLDEPFGALDPVTRDSLQQEFLSLQRSLSFTAVLVTHDMAEALLLADRIAVLQQGHLIRVGTPGELLREPGSDYVAALLETPRRHSQMIQALSEQPADPDGTIEGRDER